MNILIVKTSAIGDVTHSLPALNALRSQFPKAAISWLVEEEAADILTEHPDINRLLISPRKRWLRQLKAGNILPTTREIWRFIKELRAVKYDLLLDFQGLLKSSILIALCRAGRKAGFGRGMEHSEGSYLFLNEKIAPVSMDVHAVERELHLLNAIGIKTAQTACELPIAPQTRKEADNILSRAGADHTKPLVILNPMTTWPTKHWPPEGFAALSRLLTERGVQIAFTGSPTDRDEIAAIIHKSQVRALNLAGKTNLRQLAAVFAKAAVVISTDTGPMHIAAAAGVPIVALFGPTAPWRTGPHGGQHTIIRTAPPCSPCFKKECPTGSCMKDIKAETVYQAALLYL
ncbi:MAG TPA: lipopolysaccharide heptosyltransferase I [Desulfobacterales bacterium]|nr:lipopolysaccharide heptosyltransferase I [Desulfobacterales bacterium]